MRLHCYIKLKILRKVPIICWSGLNYTLLGCNFVLLAYESAVSYLLFQHLLHRACRVLGFNLFFIIQITFLLAKYCVAVLISLLILQYHGLLLLLYLRLYLFM